MTSRTRMTSLVFLLLELPPILVFEFDCLLCNMNMLPNILRILGRYVELNKMTC